LSVFPPILIFHFYFTFPFICPSYSLFFHIFPLLNSPFSNFPQRTSTDTPPPGEVVFSNIDFSVPYCTVKVQTYT
jgi:hypothetical protein